MNGLHKGSKLGTRPWDKSQEHRKIRVLLADQAPDICQRLRTVLQQLPYVEIVGEGNTDQQVLNLAFQLRPEVVIVSISLPDKGGFEVLRRIQRTLPGCAVILTSCSRDGSLQNAARLLGAVGVFSVTDGIAQISGMLQNLLDQPEQDC